MRNKIITGLILSLLGTSALALEDANVDHAYC